MATLQLTVPVIGPWSLITSRRFWESFAPAALAGQAPEPELRTTFRVEADWSTAAAVVRQTEASASVEVTGAGDLEAAAAQVVRFLALDVDATDWPAVGGRDPVIGQLQQQVPGLRPCGFHSPYEAAAWSVLSQRVGIGQAAGLRAGLIERYGDAGAFPAPARLLEAAPDLPGRKTEYLHEVARAALDGALDTVQLRRLSPRAAMEAVRRIKGIGPFSAELIVLRGVNVVDALPTHEERLLKEVERRYGPGPSLPELGEVWRPFRMWASFHLRALAETGRSPAARAGGSLERS